MAITILNWNIEQFGDKRSTHPARVRTVCGLIADADCDIVVLIEIKTKDPSIAIQIARLLCDRLTQYHQLDYSFNVSHHNFLETYVFLYKYDNVMPYVLPMSQRALYSETSLALQNMVLLQNDKQYSRAKKISGVWNIQYAIPLVTWPQRVNQERPLAAGFFEDVNTGDRVAVLAWHNMAGTRYGNNAYPASLIEELSQAGYIANGFTVLTSSGNVAFNDIVVTGDFNADPTLYEDEYDSFENQGYELQLIEPTYLMKWNPANDGEFSDTDELRTSCFDNFIVQSTMAATSEIIDIPDVILNQLAMRNYLINQSALGLQNDMFEVARELALKRLNSVLKDIYMPPNRKALMRHHLSTAGIVNGAVNQNQLTSLIQYLDQEDYDYVVDYYDDLIFEAVALYTHFNQVVNGTANLDINDSLLLTRTILSDHLPVKLTLT